MKLLIKSKMKIITKIKKNLLKKQKNIEKKIMKLLNADVVVK